MSLLDDPRVLEIPFLPLTLSIDARQYFSHPHVLTSAQQYFCFTSLKLLIDEQQYFLSPYNKLYIFLTPSHDLLMRKYPFFTL